MFSLILLLRLFLFFDVLQETAFQHCQLAGWVTGGWVTGGPHKIGGGWRGIPPNYFVGASSLPATLPPSLLIDSSEPWGGRLGGFFMEKVRQTCGKRVTRIARPARSYLSPVAGVTNV